MYHSTLLVNAGNDPNKPREGRKWVSNPYRIHQRIHMALPEGRFLFRLFPTPPVRILVQSVEKPDWLRAFKNAPFLLDQLPEEPTTFSPNRAQGDPLYFSLIANPTRKIDTKTGPDGKRRNGRRVPVRGEQAQRAWLERHGQEAFTIEDLRIEDRGRTNAWKDRRESASGPRDHQPEPPKGRRCQMTFQAVLYEGRLRVANPEAFKSTLITGIGPAKAFGFGLLSVAPG